MNCPKKMLLCLFSLFALLLNSCKTDQISIFDLSEVTNPGTGAALFVRVYQLESNANDLPALVLVPGGFGDSQDFEKKQKSAQTLADLGFIVVTFDPDGRGLSEGTEDYNGFIQQDSLAAVIEAVDAAGISQIGLVTFSYGITMGSGALARYPDLPVDFLIDWEGPANRNDTGGCADNGVSGHLTAFSDCSDEDFWEQREAQTFISSVAIPYLRIQTEKDHVQPDAEHALDLINAALNGESPWVRVNEGTVNAIYSSEEDLPLMDEKKEKFLMKWIGDQAKMLFELDALRKLQLYEPPANGL